MAEYSLEGYLAAAILRDQRSILLEGSSDRQFVACLLGAISDVVPSPYVLDTVDIIADPELTGGNRERVEFMVARADSENVQLAGLTDREDREFRHGPDRFYDDLDVERVSGLLFWTRGHSIENYLLTPDLLCGFLRMMYPEHVGPEVLSDVHASFESGLGELAALARTLTMSSLLSRSRDLIDRRHWQLEDGLLRLKNDAVKQSLEDRGVDIATSSACIQELELLRPVIAASAADVVRWATHGHVAADGIWTMVGFLAGRRGVGAETVEQIARGFRDVKRKHSTDVWSQTQAQEVDALGNLRDWALGVA